MKRIVTIQDISCVGKCSITVALPIISAMGVECAIVPTAVLSTHTAFDSFTFHDLTNQIEPISKEWKKLDIAFDAIYTGYLGSHEQLELVAKFFDDFGSDSFQARVTKANNSSLDVQKDNASLCNKPLIFVDPAMADFGKLYAGFDKDFARSMGSVVCSKADIIVPNLTEACFMLDAEYVEEGYSELYIKDILQGLVGLGCKKAVLTGVSFDTTKCGVMGYDSIAKSYFSYYTDRLDAKFHGTGDIFSSTAVGALMNKCSMKESFAIAADFTLDSMRCTLNNKNHNWYGVDFESAIPSLIEKIKK